jgi:hypothetical protein
VAGGEVNTLNGQGVGQPMTCLDMMKFYALLDSRSLMDTASSNEMIELLRKAQAGGLDASCSI